MDAQWEGGGVVFWQCAAAALGRRSEPEERLDCGGEGMERQGEKKGERGMAQTEGDQNSPLPDHILPEAASHATEPGNTLTARATCPAPHTTTQIQRA